MNHLKCYLKFYKHTLLILYLISLLIQSVNAQGIRQEIMELSEPIEFSIRPSEDSDYPSASDIALYLNSLDIKAYLWSFSELCKIKEPPNFNLTEKVQLIEGRFMTTGCSNIESEYAHIKAIVLTLKNLDIGNVKVPLDDIILHRANGNTIEPLFIRLLNIKNQTRYYLKKLYGKMMIDLTSGEEVDLIFLFENAAREDILKISKLKSVNLQYFGNKSTDTSILPAFNMELNGNNELRIRNPNEFTVSVGVRNGLEGKDFEVPPNGIKSVFLPDGGYEIYFIYSNKPDALFKGDSFALKNSGAEIQIVKVPNGNYQIKQIK